ncbi:MAG: multiheme c-type cytochrome [Gammaproteobacteria bacterium]
MAFKPLPTRLALVTSLILIGIVLLIAWGSYSNPEALWAPGNLSRFHADIDNCLTCHSPFKGVATGKCVTCHSPFQFDRHSKKSVSAFHKLQTQKGKNCTACHTEHRGSLAQITFGAIDNPHGEFVFRATGTQSCSDCHDFIEGKDKPALLDNSAVGRLFEEGEGMHRKGRMADCLRCHSRGLIKIEGFEEDREETEND